MDNVNSLNQAEQLAELTFRLLDNCQHKLEKIAKQLKLTIAEFKLLRSFRNDPIVTPGELARRMELSNSRLTRILDGLEKKGIVKRDSQRKDRRVTEIMLTEHGKEIQADLYKIYINTHLDILNLLPKDAGQSVLTAMERLEAAMRQWGTRNV